MLLSVLELQNYTNYLTKKGKKKKYSYIQSQIRYF